jgi:phosphatidate phosphatase APP1
MNPRTIASLLARAAAELEHHVDAAGGALSRRLGREPGPIGIVPYRSYGTPRRVHVTGRVLALGAGAVHDGSSTWRNLRDTLRRLESDEVPFARVEVHCAGVRRELLANEEGYYADWLDLETPLAGGWHPYTATLRGPLGAGEEPRTVEGRVLVAPSTARLGIISDIDDTIIRMQVDDLVALVRTTLLTHARTRTPFAGVAPFLRALHAGREGHEANPLFFVSSSPWNLYDLLEEFLALHAIPPGPLLLRDYGLARAGSLDLGHASHKLVAIRRILDAHPHLPFVLLGDTSQEDPEIYLEVVREYPGRVLACWIRDVTRTHARRVSVAERVAEAKSLGSAMSAVEDTLVAARDAAQRGLIDEAAVQEVEQAVRVP